MNPAEGTPDPFVEQAKEYAKQMKELGGLFSKESMHAPEWLIFPNHIISCKKIVCVRFENSNFFIDVEGGATYTIYVKNGEEVWKKLQEAFAYGVKRQP